MRDRHAVERHLEDVLAGLVVALSYGLGHFVGFAETNTDVTGLVANDDERAETEAPAAFDDLGDTVDVDDALLELLFVDLECAGACAVVGSIKSHRALQSELQAGGARGVGKGANAPVIEVAVAVEDDLFDALREQELGDRLRPPSSPRRASSLR